MTELWSLILCLAVFHDKLHRIMFIFVYLIVVAQMIFFCIVEDSAMVALILQKLLFYAVQYSNNRRIVLKIKKICSFIVVVVGAHTHGPCC